MPILVKLLTLINQNARCEHKNNILLLLYLYSCSTENGGLTSNGAIIGQILVLFVGTWGGVVVKAMRYWIFQ